MSCRCVRSGGSLTTERRPGFESPALCCSGKASVRYRPSLDACVSKTHSALRGCRCCRGQGSTCLQLVDHISEGTGSPSRLPLCGSVQLPWRVRPWPLQPDSAGMFSGVLQLEKCWIGATCRLQFHCSHPRTEQQIQPVLVCMSL